MFVGDVPVAMVRKAQHLTSAFKMDEEHDWFESSVPSDRFYDDFDLKFDYLRPDSSHVGYFYYELAADSPCHIMCDIYSARVKPVANGEDAYEQLRRFLQRLWPSIVPKTGLINSIPIQVKAHTPIHSMHGHPKLQPYESRCLERLILRSRPDVHGLRDIISRIIPRMTSLLSWYVRILT